MQLNTIHLGDCREILATLPENSVDAVVTDPPYELSDGGKNSPVRVFSEFMFPKDTNLEPVTPGEDCFSLLISKVSGLSSVGSAPSVAPAVKVSPVTLEGDLPGRDEQVKDGGEPATLGADNVGRDHVEPEADEYLGRFLFKFRDESALFNSLNSAGCGFFAGGVGIGFRVGPPGCPSLSSPGGVVGSGDPNIRPGNDPLPAFVGASGVAKNSPVAVFDLGGGTEQLFATRSALVFLELLQQGSAEAVRTGAGTGRLPSKLQSLRIRVVSDTAHRAVSFDVIVSSQFIHGKGFMGKAWDGSKVAFDVETWRQVLRVLKPGGHLLAFGGSRTSHRITCAIEDAGFEIRDVLQWIYGSGFPKSLDVSKAIDKEAGAEREVVGKYVHPGLGPEWSNYPSSQAETGNAVYSKFGPNDRTLTAPATDAAKQWQGWGTALKPAHEPIIMARKPLSEKTVAKNVLLHGTGGINVDACRIGTAGGCQPAEDYDLPGGIAASKQLNSQKSMPVDGLGRWPSNVILSEEAAAELDLQSGVTKSKASRRGLQNSGQAGGLAGEERNAKEGTDTVRGHSDTGGASRFFYVAKASRSERNAGLDGFELKTGGIKNASGRGYSERDPYAEIKVPNNHPTVKPLSLMQQLVRLVTPPGGVVLDPFTGSGSTLCAAASLGFNYTGVELSEEYIAIAEARVRHWSAPTVTPAIAAPVAGDVELLDFAYSPV